jgi:predicted transposase YbfD/YdcC
MNLKKHFENIKDNRVQGRCLHKLYDILVLVLCATLADCSDYAEMVDYGRDRIGFLRRDIGLELANGIPSEDTLWRVFRRLKPGELEKSMRSCCMELVGHLAERHLRIDGKELRGTIPAGGKHADLQLVSLWLEEGKLCLGQVAVGEKSNEITAIPALLDMVDCRGSVVTIDAMGCQKDIVAKITESEADYLIALKSNQKGLFGQVEDWFTKHSVHFPCHKTIEKGHGRIEKRTVYVCENLSMLEATGEWANLNSIVMVVGERETTAGNPSKRCARYYISSLKGVPPGRYGELARGHWGVENGLHWHLDVTFGEDESRVAKGNGQENLTVIRKLALHLLSKEESRISIKRKRKKAARDNAFMLKVLENA